MKLELTKKQADKYFFIIGVCREAYKVAIFGVALSVMRLHGRSQWGTLLFLIVGLITLYLPKDVRIKK